MTEFQPIYCTSKW